ncbi:MAG: alpha/beta hydrolase [Defluviitaleaceae bacterium]|nr:alpha/beta hydrolase [Defluviitaleaceae bacterium]
MLIDFNGKAIYVEVHGEGEPLVLLNGIMMSTLSWSQFISALSKNNKLILLDLLDQGQSHKMSEDYPVTLQADVVKCVLDELRIRKAHISGISYGAAVAMNFAVMYPEYVDRLVLFNCIPYTSPWLADIGEGWKVARVSPEVYYQMTIPVIYSMGFYNKRTEWLAARKKFLIENVFNNKDFLDAMERLTDSMYAHDVRDRLCGIESKTLVVGCRDDYLTPLPEQRLISDSIPNASLVIIEDCGHVTPYEKPDCFISLLTGFVSHENVVV